ncbi:MAG: threonine/serine dehydratase [Woeseiaceae bacterium]|nr:threonine/serine dehydratase [Woeseiaceae bacterium]
MSAFARTIDAAAKQAASRIAGLVRETPLEYSPQFSEDLGAAVYFKLENLQHTGSFKLRGAANRLMTLTPSQREAGVVAASSGNHGAAVAYAMQKLNTRGVIFVPEGTSSAKADAIRSYGGQIEYFGSDGLDTELHARAFADENGMVYVSPYNDEAVIAGQGSCGVEILAQLPSVDAVFAAVGGGGLVGGVGSVIRTARPDALVVGCQPEASAVMARSVEAGRILDLDSQPTLSDGTAGGIEAGAMTFELCCELVDEFAVVNEEEIAEAMRLYIDRQHQLLEGAAGVAIAGLMEHRDAIRGKNVVVIVCGGNISRERLKQVL